MCSSERALIVAPVASDQSPAAIILRGTLDSALLYPRRFLIDHENLRSPPSTAVLMDTMAVSLTSRINPGAMGYEGLSRSLRDTSMSGICFKRTVATSTTAVIAL